MPEPTCLVVADDFTGACDTGLQFVRAGLSARVLLAGDLAADRDVLVWDTESRNRPAAEAAGRVRAATRHLPAGSSAVLYKKVDSTLRGPVGSELEAMMEWAGPSLCILAPALPGAGRTTVDGIHYVDGVPVHRAEAGRDPSAPVAHSCVADLLAATSSLATAPVPLATVRAGPRAVARCLEGLPRPVVAIVDATEPGDLETVTAAAASLQPTPLLCGCAGLAAFVPAAFGLCPAAATPAAGPPRGRLLLVVAGTAHPHTARQLDHLRRSVQVRDVAVGAADEADAVAARAAAATAAGDPVCVLSVRSGEADPDAVLGVMARASHHLAGSPDLSGIAVTGGATAVGLLAALGADAVDILEPLDAEVPLCRLVDGPAAGLLLVTKGGGLGAEDAFLRAAQRLIPEGS